MKNRTNVTSASAIILALFAMLTLFLSSSIIFDWFDIRSKEGNYVSFIVWANFVVSFIYLITSYGFFKKTKWTFWALILAFIILVIAFIALQVYINNGGIYETKTVKAMIFRMLVTLIFSLIAYFKINNPQLISKTK